jgi:hypothetical protein
MSHPASDYAHGLAAVPTNRMATYSVVSTRDLLAQHETPPPLNRSRNVLCPESFCNDREQTPGASARGRLGVSTPFELVQLGARHCWLASHERCKSQSILSPAHQAQDHIGRLKISGACHNAAQFLIKFDSGMTRLSGACCVKSRRVVTCGASGRLAQARVPRRIYAASACWRRPQTTTRSKA